jgi:hypothetical protein
LGGGAGKNFFSAANGPVIASSFPTGGGTGWSTSMQTVNGVSNSWTITGYAICARVS